jgi:hypothetical protein
MLAGYDIVTGILVAMVVIAMISASFVGRSNS